MCPDFQLKFIKAIESFSNWKLPHPRDGIKSSGRFIQKRIELLGKWILLEGGIVLIFIIYEIFHLKVRTKIQWLFEKDRKYIAHFSLCPNCSIDLIFFSFLMACEHSTELLVKISCNRITLTEWTIILGNKFSLSFH